MIIYGLFSVLTLLIANIDIAFSKNKLIVKYVLFLLIILVIGLRYELGIDWLFYLNSFNGNSTNTLTIEPGYQLLSSFISYLGFGFWSFVCMISIFILFILYRFFKKYSPFPLFCLSIYFILSFGFNIEALRQIIAVAIFYIALSYYLNGKKKHYIALCLLASSFHISAIIFITLPFIDNAIFKRLMKISVLFGVAMSVVGLYPIEIILETLTLFSYNPYLEKIHHYTLNAGTGNIFTYNLLVKIIIISYYFIKKKHIYFEFANKKIPLNFASSLEIIILTMLIIDVYFGKYGTITSRIDEYFIPIFIILVSYLIMINKSIVNKLVFSILFSCYVLIAFIRFTSNEYFQNQYIPYRNSLYSKIIGENASMAREQAVKLHWIERKK
ncbi:EpsG family protein [Yersinia kristensenii]|uniref:EpsG family protein n=1 Tax=Yersinia kristensenii TaxID=28152 RepID=UPI0005DC77FD|nr:EpsG family protein [Yersinia kristensenii]CNE79995.1 Uncharacterised protein [Yersinia kristensenii]